MSNKIVIPLHVCSTGIIKNYSYVVYKKGGSEAIVIDPAWELDKYEAVFMEHSIIPKVILLTHAHYDHTNLLESFLKLYPISVVWISEAEYKVLDFEDVRIKTFKHQDDLDLGLFKAQAYITPGHTLGSSCFLIYPYLFTGDTLFIEGCGMCFDDQSDPGELYDSLGFLKKNIPGDVAIYPGHCYGEYLGQLFKEVYKKNIYLNIQNKETFIKFRMRPHQTRLFDFK